MKSIREVLKEYKFLDFGKEFSEKELEHIYYVMAVFGNQFQSPVEAAAKDANAEIAAKKEAERRYPTEDPRYSRREAFELGAEWMYTEYLNPVGQGQEESWVCAMKAFELSGEFPHAAGYIDYLQKHYTLIKKQP